MLGRDAKLTSVVLADGDPATASALEPVLRELDRALVQVDAEDALLHEAQQACLVVLDVDFAEPLGGLRIARELLQRGRRVVYLSARPDTQIVSQAKLTHPYGFLLKPLRSFDLRSCLELALQRVGGLPTSTHRTPSSHTLATLTARERDVLRLIAKGHTSKDIASTLAIAKATVDTYRGRVAEKLGAKSRADLVRIAHDTGLLD